MFNYTILIDTILKIGSLAGLVGLVYQIHNNRKHRPRFRFTFEASYAEFYKKNKLSYCDYHFSGILRNESLSPNTLVRLYLTVWENKKKGSTLRFGHSVKKLEEINTSKQLFLPLGYKPKQAYRLNITFDFPITGTQDQKILSAYETKTMSDGETKVRFPKHRYEFLMEDVNGNFFDQTSSQINRELINLWWTLGNFSKNPGKYGREILKIVFQYLKWKFERFLSGLGFYR